MKKRALCLLLPLFFLFINETKAQIIYGTTGLLRMPTANMQKDKTFLFGGNMIDHRTLSSYWSKHSEYTPFTYNYTVNMTLFPWMEVAYSCTLVKGLYNSNYWPKRTWGKFSNQDRSFHLRFRIWEEGKWKDWMPQIVLGTNDPGTHSTHGGGAIDIGGGEKGNHNYLTRYYLVASKHFEYENLGELGVHVAFIVGKAMGLNHYNRPAAGVNFQLKLPESNMKNKLLNGLNLMAEYDACTINLGGTYAIWRDNINVVAELNNGKYFSAGVYFKLHLK